MDSLHNSAILSFSTFGSNVFVLTIILITVIKRWVCLRLIPFSDLSSAERVVLRRNNVANCCIYLNELGCFRSILISTVFGGFLNKILPVKLKLTKMF